MATKIRKQIYLDPDQNEIIKQTSQKMGVSEAEVIRQAIITQVRRMRMSQNNMAAWESELKFITSLVESGKIPGQRSWQREDLYDR